MSRSKMKKFDFLPLIAFIFTLQVLFLSAPIMSLAQEGVDDFRGRWDFYLNWHEHDPQPFTVFIGDLKYSEEAVAFLATGCMESPSQSLSPLALKAEKKDDGVYDVIIYATVIPGGGANAFLIQLKGPVYTFGKGVADDIAGGDNSQLITESGNVGTWSAKHHDRRRAKCPPVEIPPLSFGVDVRAQCNFRNGNLEIVKTILEGQTDIVSSGVLVEKPDGSTVYLPPYTDIFSPDVDFVSKFRYFIPFDEADNDYPSAGEPYYFTLLDVFGDPIPGSTQTDIWTGCFISAPKNITATVENDQSLTVNWSPVPKADGFDPINGVGFYQIEIGGSDPLTPDLYGSNHIKSTSHLVPWNDFIPPSVGYPDGFDLGVGLSQFPSGTYQLRVEAFSTPPEGSGGRIHECVVVDFGENATFRKTDDGSITIP